MNHANVNTPPEVWLADILSCPVEEIVETTSTKTHSGWDSLAHAEVLIYLQSRYGIEIDNEAIETYSRFSAIRELDRRTQTVARRGASAAHYFDPNAFADTLRSVGITEGDTLLIHSGLQYFQCHDINPATVLEVIRSVVGPSGTIASPGSNLDAYVNGCYDIVTTPVGRVFGVLAELIRQQPKAIRSANPFDCVIALGGRAEELITLPNLQAYGANSPWRNAIAMGAKTLFLGVGVRYATVLHVAELDAAVSYRRWMTFNHPTFEDGVAQNIAYELYARDLDCFYDFGVGEKRFAKEGIFQCTTIHNGNVTAVSCVDLNRVGLSIFAEDETFFLVERDVESLY